MNVDVCIVGIDSHCLLKAGFGFLHLILASKYPRLLQQGVHIHLREGEGREVGREGREGREGRKRGEGGKGGGVGRDDIQQGKDNSSLLNRPNTIMM